MSRKAQGALLLANPPLRLKRGGLYARLRDAIIDGTLAARQRLPASRVLADEHGVSRSTVEAVYDQLMSEGLVERHVGRGSFVTAMTVRAPKSAAVPFASSMPPSERGAQLGADARGREPMRLQPFNAGVPDVSTFPQQAWERCLRQATRSVPSGWLNHCDAMGYRPLREALARYLAQFRGIRADADQVLVFGSTAQAFHALCLLLLDPGDRVWCEDPGYPNAVSILTLVGAEPVPVPVDGCGIDVAAGKRIAADARMAYVTPAHQYPTGARMAHERRRSLLDWAHATGAVVVEDDYDADFRYRGEPLTTLHALDGGCRTLYLGTLSKSMFLGLRVAYAVVPASLAERLANIRALLDGFPPVHAQMALARFIEEGHLSAHVRHMRRAYESKLSALLEGVQPLLAQGWEVGPADAGLHVVLFESAPGEAARVARRVDMALRPLSNYAQRSLPRNGLSLGFGGLSIEEIREGAAQLCRRVETPARRAR